MDAEFSLSPHFLSLRSLVRRLTSLLDEMCGQVSAECRRQGAWALLGEATGAKLFCANTRTVLSKEHIFGELQSAPEKTAT